MTTNEMEDVREMTDEELELISGGVASGPDNKTPLKMSEAVPLETPYPRVITTF
jgi:bacteriocin-like protein